MPKIKQLLAQQAAKELAEKIVHFKSEISSKLFHSDLDILKRHYQLNRSYLSRLADWYSERPWWKKLFLGIAVIGGVLLFTAALYALSVITILALIVVNLLAVALYVNTVIVLTNHAKKEKERFEYIASQLQRFETELQTTIQSLQCIEQQLATLLHELNEQQDILDDYALAFEKRVAHLNQELEMAKNIITKLGLVIETLQNDTASQQILNQTLTEQLQTLQQVVISDTDKVKEIGNQLIGNAKALSETEALLKSINQTLTACDNAFKTKLDTLDEQIKTTTVSAEQLNENEAAIQETISQSQTLCQQASTQLQQSLANDLEDQAFLARLPQATLSSTHLSISFHS